MCSTHVRIAREAASFPRLRNTAVPGDAHQRRLTVADLLDEFVERALGFFPCLGYDSTSALPGGHDSERDDTDEQWKPGAVYQLRQVRRTTNSRSISSRMPPPIVTSHSGACHLVRA